MCEYSACARGSLGKKCLFTLYGEHREIKLIKKKLLQKIVTFLLHNNLYKILTFCTMLHIPGSTWQQPLVVFILYTGDYTETFFSCKYYNILEVKLTAFVHCTLSKIKPLRELSKVKVYCFEE